MPHRLRCQPDDDRPLPIGCQQTISQLCLVADMTDLLALEGSEKVLKIEK
jgi:protein-L-isoaspartate O-methyltransferase